MNIQSVDLDQARLKTHQNIMRGLIGELKQRRPEDGLLKKKAPRRKAADIFFIGFRRALMNAKGELPPESFDAFFDWLNTQLATVGNVREFPATRSALDGVFAVKSLGPASELHWAANRINQYPNELTAYTQFQSALSLLVVQNELDSALILIQIAEMQFGASLDLYDVALACRQLSLGLESQKNYSLEIRTGFRKAIYSFVVAFTSVRNEPGTSWNRYRDDVAAKISGLDLDPEIKVYLRHMLTGDGFSTEEDALDALAVAQNYSIPDIYRLFLDVAEWAATSDVSPLFLQQVRQQLSRLKGVSDPRIDRLVASLTVTSEAAGPSPSMFEQILCMSGNDIRPAYRRSMRRIRSSSCDFMDYVVASVCCAETAHSPKGFSALTNDIIGDLASVMATGAAHPSEASSLQKSLQNLSKMPLFSDLRLVAKAFFDPSFISQALRLFGQRGAPSNANQRCQIRAKLLAGPDTEQSASLLEQAARDESVIIRRLATHFLIRLEASSGNHEAAIELLARAATSSPDPDVTLPVEAAVANLRWADLRPFADSIAVSIALDLYWKSRGDEKTATLRRFAFHEFLKRRGIKRPSELVHNLDAFSRDQLVFFLKHVCVPSVMDMSSFFEGSSAVEDEYARIQELLIDLDPSFAGDHQQNLAELRSKRIISEGLEIVDSSRVHVDIEALSSWARREMTEYFTRYASLVKAGVGVASNLEDVLREINSADARHGLELPTSEADVILIEQTRRLRDEFLHNAENGLDSYLSRRVRHHPLTAALRSPVEFTNLITTRIGQTAQYRENQFWLNRVEDLSDDQKEEFISAFRDFATDFDDILADLKDIKFHIRSIEKPEGLFEIPLGPLQHHVVRSIVQMDFSFELFLKESFGLFFGILETSLSNARAYLNGPVKQKVADAFDRLRYRLHKCAGNQKGYSELASTCSSAATDVQKKISEVSLWFTRTEGIEAGKTFTLEQVIDIGIKSALDPHKEYTPNISVNVDEDHVLISANVAIIAEFLLVVLNNARQHGGLSRGQKINIVCRTDPDSETLTLKIESSIAPRVKTAEAQRRVDELNAMIKAKKFDRAKVRREGGSGFVKIASVVSQSKKGRIDFGFNGPDEFFVEVVYSFIVIAEGGET